MIFSFVFLNIHFSPIFSLLLFPLIIITKLSQYVLEGILIRFPSPHLYNFTLCLFQVKKLTYTLLYNKENIVYLSLSFFNYRLKEEIINTLE